MNQSSVFIFFNSKFLSVHRSAREKILCAMIRINYGTPWDGDQEQLRDFFPKWFQRQLTFGGLTELIESLSPFSDETTEPGILVEEPTLLDGDQTNSCLFETTEDLGEMTTDTPLYAHKSEITDTLVKQNS